jgi:flagellar motor switch protein FliM
MASPASPAETRAFILERLVGDTGEPGHVIDAARALGERASPAILQGLSETLSLAVAIELKTVELARFATAMPTGEGYAMTVAASGSSPDALILTLDPQAVAVIVSALFGGDPDMAISPIERDLSPTETEVATLVFEEIAKAVNGSGARAFEFKLPLPAAITGADLKKHILRDGPGVRVVFSVSTPAGSGNIALMMPQRVLLKHRGGTGAAPDSGSGPSADWRQRFSEEVMRSSVDLHATMPLARMTLGQLAGLHEGQIIELEEQAQSQARLSARQKTLFICEFGKLGQNYTVRIRHPFDAGQDFIDGLLPG